MFLSKGILVWIISDIYPSYRITALSESSGISRKPAFPLIVIGPAFKIGAWGNSSVTRWCMGSEIPKPLPSSKAISLDPGLRESWMGCQEEMKPCQCLSYTKEHWQQHNWQGSTWRLQRASLFLKSIISASLTLRRPNRWKSITHWFLLCRTKDI